MSIPLNENTTELIPADERPGTKTLPGHDLEDIATWGSNAGWAPRDGEDVGTELPLIADLDRRIRISAKNIDGVISAIEGNHKLSESGKYEAKLEAADKYVIALEEMERLYAGRVRDVQEMETNLEQRGLEIGGEIGSRELFIWGLVRDMAGKSGADGAGVLELETFYLSQVDRIVKDKPSEADWITLAIERLPSGIGLPTLPDRVRKDGLRRKGEIRFPIGAERLARMREGVRMVGHMLPTLRRRIEAGFALRDEPPAATKANRTNFLAEIADGRRRLKQ